MYKANTWKFVGALICTLCFYNLINRRVERLLMASLIYAVVAVVAMGISVNKMSQAAGPAWSILFMLAFIWCVGGIIHHVERSGRT